MTEAHAVEALAKVAGHCLLEEGWREYQTWATVKRKKVDELDRMKTATHEPA